MTLKKLSKFMHEVGVIHQLFFTVIINSFSKPFYIHNFLEQIKRLGIGSLSITMIIGFNMGMVMTLNFGHGLVRFGGVLYVPAIVTLSIVREMAPLFTSLLIAGRIGSGMASELGSMKVSDQIDGLRALGISPIRFLVIPRFWASVISLPLLTSLSAILGILGSLLICMTEYDMGAAHFYNKMIDTVKLHDYLSGLVKSLVFGIIISIIACYRGLHTRGGTAGVGISTTWVVVTSSILILITDYFISKIFLVFW